MCLQVCFMKRMVFYCFTCFLIRHTTRSFIRLFLLNVLRRGPVPRPRWFHQSSIPRPIVSPEFHSRFICFVSFDCSFQVSFKGSFQVSFRFPFKVPFQFRNQTKVPVEVPCAFGGCFLTYLFRGPFNFPLRFLSRFLFPLKVPPRFFFKVASMVPLQFPFKFL